MTNKRTNNRSADGETVDQETESHKARRRKSTVSIEQRLESRLLQNLVNSLIDELEESGLTKPAFAEKLGISGSQFRYLRSGVANPSIGMLASFAERLQKPLYEILEHRPLEHRRNLSGEEMNSAFSASVKSRYSESGMSYAEFAEYLGVSVPQFYLILRGVANPALLMVEQIARRLIIDLWVLLGVESKPDPARKKSRKMGRSRSKCTPQE
jgi:transcriptional regulator with XRE-family HTH domain